MSTVNILGVSVNNVNMQEALQRTVKIIEAGEPQIIVTPNSEIVVQARNNQSLGEVIEKAFLSLPDGIGLVWASRLKGQPLKERVPGIDFMTELLSIAAREKYRIYFLGARPGVAEEAAVKMRARFPGLNIVGTHHGYFTAGDEQDIVEDIKSLKPHILFVGLGAGKQEKWIQKHYQELGVPVSVGIGGSFDVLAGRLSRAPLFFRNHGLEWFYRFMQEPFRVVRLLSLLKFVVLVYKEHYFNYSKRKKSGDTFNLLGIRVDRVTYSMALERIELFIKQRKPNFVVAINPEKIVKIQADPELKEIIKKAGLCIADGAGILWAARLLGSRLPERVTGIDLMLSTVEMAAQKGYSLFLLGARPGTAQKVAAIWREQYPPLDICGTHHGYFSREEEDEVVEKIKQARPDIIFIALGSPKQEKWINKYLEEIDVPVCLGVGGSFDVITGTVKRAPEWMRHWGLEWNYRLLKEPKRIVRMMALPKFVFMVLSYKLKSIFN